MARELDYEWRLRQQMAARGMFSASDLAPHLAARGMRLSDSQVWRLVTGKPERLNLRALIALCDILSCSPNDLIEPIERAGASRKRAAGGKAVSRDITPQPARVARPKRP